MKFSFYSTNSAQSLLLKIFFAFIVIFDNFLLPFPEKQNAKRSTSHEFWWFASFIKRKVLRLLIGDSLNALKWIKFEII